VTNSSLGSLPEYDAPPLDEVVCGILFKPIETLLVPYFGVFWERLKPEYPTCQEVAPLAPSVERLDDSPRPDLQISVLPRIWFLHQSDTQVIQLQRDRFLYNWRKRQPSDEYPRYSRVIENFQNHLLNFQNFLNELNIGTITPLQYELTYVNLILQGSGWDDISDINKVFPDFAWRTNKQRFLSEPEGFSWQTSFRLQNRMGRLRVHIQKAQRRNDNHPLFRFELIARGMANDTSSEARRAWFDAAHESAVRGFADVTADELQKTLWRRKQ
jgi:uncharacterized protein (TIGR04255 family)